MEDFLDFSAESCFNNHNKHLEDMLPDLKQRYPSITIVHMIARMMVLRLKDVVPELSADQRNALALASVRRVFQRP
jgi:hypothetical protein